MIELILITALGVLIGIFTGLIPGIHPNTVVFSAIPLYFAFEPNFLHFGCLVVGINVSHTFHDFLPSVFLGVAEAESALASVPGAELAARGRGLDAFQLTVVGGQIAMLTILILLVPIYLYAGRLYGFIQPVMAYLLAFFLLFAVFKAPNSNKAFLVSISSAFLGLLAFELPVNQNYVLIPVFAGLFAVPALVKLLGADEEIIDQLSPRESSLSYRGGVFGVLAGLIAGLIPGVGAATSTTMLTPAMESEKDFLAGIGAVNTSDIVVSFLALQTIGSARSGAAVALSSLSKIEMTRSIMLIGASFLSAGLASLISLEVGKRYASFISSVRPESIVLMSALPIILAVGFLTGFLGFLVFFTASCIGVAARESNSRASCMAVLIVPAIAFYIGFSL